MLILTSSFQQIISYFFFVVVIFIAMTVAGLFIIRKEPFEGYRTPMIPVTPVVFLALTATVLALIAMNSPLQTVIGIAVVLLGLPVYYYFFNRKEPR